MAGENVRFSAMICVDLLGDTSLIGLCNGMARMTWRMGVASNRCQKSCNCKYTEHFAGVCFVVQRLYFRFQIRLWLWLIAGTCMP